MWLFFSFHSLKFSLLLHMIGRSLLHESLFCFVFKNVHPSQGLLPPLMLYHLLHKLFFLSAQPFSHSQNSVFGPLLFLYVQPWKSHWLTASNLKSLKSIPVLKSIQYVLLKLVQISLLSSFSNCLLASPVDRSPCVTSNLKCSKLASLNSFAVSFSSKSYP